MEGAFSGVTCSYSRPSGSTPTNGPCPHNPMHPTRPTSTRSVMPLSFTAFSSAVLISADREERQPAAMQHLTRIGLRAALSFSAIAVKSSCTMAQDPSDSLNGLFRRLVAGHHSVINHCRCDRAAADATRRQQGELLVRGRFARFDPCAGFDRGQHLCAALNVARGAKADDAGVHPLRLEREKVVESRNAIKPARWNMQCCRDKLQGIFIKVAKRLLHSVKNFDQRMRLIVVTAHPGIYDFPPFVRRWKRWFRELHPFSANV